MEKLLKVLWILTVYLIHLSSCDVKSEFLKQFNYFGSDDLIRLLHRRSTVLTNSNVIAVKCPRVNITISNVHLQYGRQADIKFEKIIGGRDPFMRYRNKEDDPYEWNIYDFNEEETTDVDCVRVKGNISNTFESFWADWKHEIRRTTKHQKNIVEEWNVDYKRTIALGVKSGKRDFDSKNPNLYKGDILVTFNNDGFYNEHIEFLEPVVIRKINHPLPFISIHKNHDIEINYDNKEWWLVELDFFPNTLYIKLLYNGTTNQPGFFDYENINVSYLRYSKDNKLEEIKKEILTPLSNNKRNITIKESVIVKFQYNCDDCGGGGRQVFQKSIIGTDLVFEDEILPSIEYTYDKLYFNLNCIHNHNGFTHLKSVLYKNLKIDVKELHQTNESSIANFMLYNDVVMFKTENPSGKLTCFYIYPFGEFQTSQTFKYFKDKYTPLITYPHGELHFKPNCSMNQDKSAILKTVLFDKERIEIDDLKSTSNGIKGNFKYNETLVTFTGINPNGKLSCIYKLTYGEVSRNETYKFFSNESMPFVKPHCSMDQGNSTNLGSVLFNDESIEVDDLKNATGATKGNFKIEGKKVIFMGSRPEGKLSCIYKLTHGKYQIIQGYKYFKTTKYPLIRYASDQLPFKANCSKNPKENVNLTTIMFNDESIKVGDLENTSDRTKGSFKLDGGFVIYKSNNPIGRCVCVYKLFFGEIQMSRTYESIQHTVLPDVNYAYGQLNFNPNCSRKENDFTQLKTIMLNDKRIEVEGLDDAALSQMKNLKSTKKLLLYTVKNPEGKFICIYKVPIGEVEKSQNYKPILNETLPVVYSFNELGYKANCSVSLNNYTNLKHISFKDDKIEFRFLKLRKFQERGRLKLEKDFVINTENNPNGTLHCLYDVPIGEVLVKKEFKTFRTDNGQISRNEIGVMGSMILAFVIVVNTMILVI
uniref:Ig-like domain-containing protein n=1 Tax=Strongyloides papillosus TaxID=174720 RepID=A0A0N5BQ95_STREA